MFSPLMMKVAQARIEDMHRDAARARVGRHGHVRSSAVETAEIAITIRCAVPDDGVALTRLAVLDTAPVPTAPVLLAEADGRLRAALSLHDGASVVDPFYPSVGILGLLTARAAQLRGGPRRPRLLTRLARGNPTPRRQRTAFTRST
jgi:hypothetical protein